ncbi:MAG: polyprenol monophosphomannose synthase [Myxococcales bacterium]
MTPRDALVVLPTYDEIENLTAIVPAVFAASDRIEILVVDDNSPDGTGRLADELAAKEPRLHVLHRPRKEGLGRAYLAGFAWALERPYERVLEMDADFSHDPRHLPALLEASGGADLVLGSRYVPGGGTENWGLGRRLLSRGGSLYARTLLGVRIRDLTGGFKCFRRGVLERLDLGSVRSEGYSFQIELTYRALSLGLRVVEVPIRFADRRVGKSKMSKEIFAEAVAAVIRLRLDRRRFVARAASGR